MAGTVNAANDYYKVVSVTTTMKQTALVSVIVPVYNDGAYLAIALESLLHQSLGDFEVVVADDASSDGSVALAHAFGRRDPRFRVVVNDENLGMTRNWNRALAAAQGKYVVKLDADDAVRPETLQRLVDAMEDAHGPMVSYCRTLSCDANLEPFSSYLGERALIRAGIEPMQVQCRPGHDWYRLSFDDLQLWHSNAQMHRRATLLEMGGWDESWGCAADTDLILRVLERNGRVCHIPYAGVLYRHRPGSVSDQYRRQTWLAWESVLIHLDSLNRYHAAGGRLTTPLRKTWWRYFAQWGRLRAQGEDALAGLRPDLRERLLRRAHEVAAPPRRVLVEGAARQFLWNVMTATTRIGGADATGGV